MSTEGNNLKKRFGERLRRARLLRGLSLEGLATEMGHVVTRMALSKYERGLMGPDSSVLVSICDVLDLEPDFFFRDNDLVLSGIAFRKQSKFGKKAQDQVREQALEFFERYLDIESILEIEAESLPVWELNASEDLGEQVERIAYELRTEIWKLGENALPNVHMLLEERGVKVKEVDAPESFNGFSGWAESAEGRLPVVVLAKHLNTDLPRKRFTELHELGHLVLEFPKGFSEKDIEVLCHRFAGAFLVPKGAFIDAFGGKRPRVSIPELKAIKQEWGISLAAIMKRAETLGLVSSSTYKGFCIYMRTKGWNKVEPSFSEWVGSESASRFKHLVYRAYTCELLTQSKAASLLGLTLPEFAAESEFATI
ncbi:XRE family transcriptional regulator [Puniceicoccaceae bacterium K14]|nr:XRE family transcriptional regulator [Puniceicoccaceae bacterium K14]